MRPGQQASPAAGAFIARRRVMIAALVLMTCAAPGGCAQTYYRVRLPDGRAPVEEAAQQESVAGTFTEMPSGAVPGTRMLAVGDNARLTLTSGRCAKGLVRAVGDTILLQGVHRNATYIDVIPARTVTRVELAGKPMTPIEKSIMVLGVPMLVGVIVFAGWLALGGSGME
jgi:hypothetical protein